MAKQTGVEQPSESKPPVPEIDDAATLGQSDLTQIWDKLQRGIRDIHVNAEQGAIEAKNTLAQKLQEADLELRKKDAEAALRYRDALRVAWGSEEYPKVQLEQGQEAERVGRSSRAEAQQQIDLAHKEFGEVNSKLEVEFYREVKGAYGQFVGELRNLWLGLDPASVNSADLITLGRMTMEAAAGLQNSTKSPPQYN